MNALLDVFSSRRMLLVLVMGFASGLPIALTGGTLQAWLTEEGISTKSIGLFNAVGVPYTLKFVWSPMMDRFTPSFLGRRRGWMLITQLTLIVLIALMGFSEPAQFPIAVALIAIAISFASASQDIVIDAYRAEILKKEELGAGAGVAIMGYRIAMITSGAFALILAATLPWKTVYFIMAGVMSVGLLATYFAPEPKLDVPPPRTLADAVIQPFREYFLRRGAIEILAFVVLYKLGDVMALALQTNFLLLKGYTKAEIGFVAKFFGLACTIIGSLVGGALIARMGIKKALLTFGLIQGISIMSFSWLAAIPKDLWVMAAAMAFENLGSGLGNAAYIGFMMGLCNRRFTATQYALLTSLGAITRVGAGSLTGFLSEEVGWTWYFFWCTVAAAPGLLLVYFRFDTWATSGEEKESTN